MLKKSIDQIANKLRSRIQLLQTVELISKESPKDESYFVRIGWIVLVGGFGGFML